MTVLFGDDFRTGNFNAWTGISGSPTIVTSPVHNGTYAMSINAPFTAVYKNIAGQSTIFYRAYFYVAAVGGEVIFQALTSAAWDELASIVRTSSGFLGLYFRSGSDMINVNSATAFPLGEWVSIEIKMVVHATVGEYRVYLNGNEITDLTQTGLNTSNYGNIAVIIAGTGWIQSTATVYIADVVASDAYIGPALPPTNFTLTYQSNPIVVPCTVNGQTLNPNSSIQVPSGTSIIISVPSEVTV